MNGEYHNGSYITLYNSSGETITKTLVQTVANGGLDMSKYVPGIYILQYENGEIHCYQVIKK